ncbi:cap binding protein [Verticillium alfalfae VaMs.102]|uniref:Cap binding protein n=1 Tax=Verticillium alfalfae (strain VaMs.102 / ATCC MYA-4576 / FGSC 10136) TaxID=526221 RepID=C9S8W0_VERA1|nr:cap binding protein [Verticillium alfalfae VaMs.102]EEY14037.1 cap binding protein [Verticillium alfalfae VaMs.102]
MGDYDRRRNGGGGGGGGHNRKRRYREDDEQDYRQQRRRHEPPPLPVRIRKQLLNIAESPLRRWHEEVQSIAHIVADNVDDTELRENFIDLVLQLAVEQPLKTPFTAAVILFINTLRPEIVEDILGRLSIATETKIREGHWRDAKLLLKLFACLQSCLGGDGIFPILEELLGRALDLQTASSEDTIGTELVKIILLTIPYIMAAHPEQWQHKAAQLMGSTEIIASEPHPLQALIDPFIPEAEGAATGSASIISLLQRSYNPRLLMGGNWLACLGRGRCLWRRSRPWRSSRTPRSTTCQSLLFPKRPCWGHGPLSRSALSSVYARSGHSLLCPPAPDLRFFSGSGEALRGLDPTFLTLTAMPRLGSWPDVRLPLFRIQRLGRGAKPFLDWFAHHLSNFGFTWKWTEWVNDVFLPDIHPSKAFIRGALDKEIRLSFAQRIKNTLPEEYQSLISPDTEKDVPDFKFSDETTPFSAEGRELAALLKRKVPDEEFQPVLDRIHAAATEHSLDALVTSTDVFVTAVCWVGSKSLSHVLACIERVKDRLLDIGAASEAARAQIITAVMAYWRAQPGVAISIIEKLLNYSILTPLSVIEWSLVYNHSEREGDALAEAHVFELVSNTVTKVTGRVRQIMTAPELDADAEASKELDKKAMRDLFTSLKDALSSWKAGIKDEMLDEPNSEERKAHLQRWGARWLRVFERKSAIEEAFLLDVKNTAQNPFE